MRGIDKTTRPRLATILAGLALLVALGGTATAASGLINGKKIKNRTITGKKLKNGTVTKNKIAPATVKALQGQIGPQGPKGAPGQDGVANPEFGSADSVVLPANIETDVVSLSVAAGRYLVMATANLKSSGTGNASCVVGTSDGEFSPAATWKSPVANSSSTVPLEWITEASVTTIKLICHPGTVLGGANGTLIAVPVS